MVKTSTRIVGALALAGALVCSGPVLAAKPAQGGGGLIGDLTTPARDSAIVMVPVDCGEPGQTTTASLSVKIFQSVGRLLNIGTGSAVPNCTGQAEDVPVTVYAIPGLKFQPGPATILITLTEQTSTVDPVTGLPVPGVSVIESGARVDLRP